MSNTTVSFQFLVTGQVQGVGFRNFVLGKSDEFDLSGWVRNLIDGRVEVVACGDEMSINRFAMELNKGPELSNVISVERYPIDGGPVYTTFKIERDGEEPWQK